MVLRKYNISDPAMISDANTTLALFDLYKADFIATDPDFDAPFAADWAAQIAVCEGLTTNEQRLDLQQGETADVLLAMKTGRSAAKAVLYFVKKAYSANIATINFFGADDYSDDMYNQKTLPLFLKHLYDNANSATYKPALLAANCTQAKIDAVLAAFNNFKTENNEQNVFIKLSPVDTEANIIHLNACWDFRLLVNEASKVVYEDDAVKRNLFTLPRRATGGAEEFNAQGRVVDGSGNPIAGVTVTVQGTAITTTTDANGEWGLADVTPGAQVFVFEKPGLTTANVNGTVPPTGVVEVNVVMS